jgi:hypothetical protein
MLFNQILNPRLVSPLVRMFGMKTGANPAPTLAPEVQPTIDTNQQDDAAQYFLRRSRIVGCRFTINAIVGQQGEWQLRNPAGSGVLVVLRTLRLMDTVGNLTMDYGTRITGADYGTIITTGGTFDTRWILTGSSVRTAIVSAQTSAVPIIYTMGRVPGQFNDPIEVPVVLAPGTSLNGLLGTANAAATVELQWEERIVAAEELQTG